MLNFFSLFLIEIKSKTKVHGSKYVIHDNVICNIAENLRASEITKLLKNKKHSIKRSLLSFIIIILSYPRDEMISSSR